MRSRWLADCLESSLKPSVRGWSMKQRNDMMLQWAPSPSCPHPAFLLLGHLAWLQMWQTHRGHGAVIAGCCVCSDGSVDGESSPSPSCSSLHMSTNQDDLLTDGALSINAHLYFRSPLTNSPSHTHRHTIIYMSYAQRKFWQSPHPKIDQK